MLVSIVTIVFNDVRNIERTIQSVVNQTYSPIEYIVIDGGSNDGTTEVIKKYSEKIDVLITEKDKGIYDAMNKGIKAATGQWIAFMNSNDTFHSATTIEDVFMSNFDSYDVVYGNFSASNRNNIVIKPRLLNEFWVGMPFNHQATFVRTDLHKKEPFQLKYKVSAVYAFFFLLYTKQCSFKYLDITVADYDMTGISHHSFYWLWDYWRINLKYSKSKIISVMFKLIRYTLSRIKTNINRIK